MRKIATLGLIAAIGMGSSAIAAEGVSHSFVEAGYGYGELAGGAVDGDGFRVGGSLELPANFVAAASYRDFTFEEGGSEADISELSAGLGYKWALGDTFDLIAGASFEQLEFNGESESGFGLNVGTRGRLNENWELAAALQYQDISEVPSTFNVNLGVRRYFTPAFAVGVDVRKSDLLVLASETSFIATLRYDFGDLF
jgi:hypothetical protein